MKKYLDFIRRRSERAGFENIIFVLAGRVAIIEHKKKGFDFVSLFGHHTSRDAIVRAMEKGGYSEVRSFDFLPDQTFTLFMKREQADF
jgi:hypothetical protein